MTPTARTLRYLRDLGHVPAVVERWNPHARIRQDLFGFLDIVSIEGANVCGWQACAGSSVAARVAKIRAHPLFPTVARAMKVNVIGWRMAGQRGKRKRWEPRIVSIEKDLP
jgi:hypothetical protein